MVKIDYRLYKIAKAFDPDICMGIHNPYPAQVGRLLGKKVITFTDTESAKLAGWLTYPFSSEIVTPSCFELELGKKHTRYKGYHELAYLHPHYFTPDPSVLDLLEVGKDEKYVIVRFVSRGASHDVGHGGIDFDIKRKAVKEFSKYAKVFISSEDPLPKDLTKHRINIPPSEIHDAMYYADLLYGESATMASECAVLGTPSIFVDKVGRGYTTEQERLYNSVFNYSDSKKDQKASIEKGAALLQENGIKEKWRKKREKLLEDKIDVTEFMMDFVEKK